MKSTRLYEVYVRVCKCAWRHPRFYNMLFYSQSLKSSTSLALILYDKSPKAPCRRHMVLVV